MPTLHTIGYQGKRLSVFIDQLREVGVDAVIDVRLRNTSHLAGYSKRDDLDFLLREGFSIAYQHRVDLAPTPEIFEAYREELDWPTYEADFGLLLVERKALEIGRGILARYRAPCLLCAEPTAERCHRRLVTEYWQKHIPGLVVVHL
jgi:uncharacterized protein (DUF488 family)